MTRKQQFFGIGAILIVVLSLGYTLYVRNTTSLTRPTPSNQEQIKIKLTIGSTTINAYVADTPQKQETGLSGRKNLPSGEGMWFIFPKSEIYAFWMPDMHFAIDIIWIDSQFRIIDISQNVTPESYPRRFSPAYPAQYVLEVPSGYASLSNIAVGMLVAVGE